MDAIDAELRDIGELLRVVKPDEAERRFRAVVDMLGDEDLKLWEPDLKKTAEQFHKKRRRALLQVLDDRLAARSNRATAPVSVERPKLREADVIAFETAITHSLQELSRWHIFQWSTHYRETLRQAFVRATALAREPETIEALKRALAKHSTEIFSKGYSHVSVADSHPIALTKSLGGLQRFLELPVEFYTGSVAANQPVLTATRLVASAMLSGIIEGYGQVRFGETLGTQLLIDTPRAWAHYLGFLTSKDLSSLVSRFEPTPFRDGLTSNVLPLIEGIENLLGRTGADRLPVPVLSQLIWESRRVDIALQSPSVESAKLVEVQAYIDGGYVTDGNLLEAANRGVSVIVAPLRPDIAERSVADDALRPILVDTAATTPSESRERVVYVLRSTISRYEKNKELSAPLSYNVARNFPLHNPFLSRYFHVYRRSVRDLLRTFERRNGVRLWCSVRRSGKTTACFDLSTTTGTSMVVSQTCDNTEADASVSAFYEEVVRALQSGEQIGARFFYETVVKCAALSTLMSRYVFVLDEYETLFARLRLACDRDEELRYTVVQPLLNQMVAFSRENLIVFIGQRPDAHFVLMDQNQLSAYVQQDAFPLFEHTPGSEVSELSELLRKVLTDRLPIVDGFADSVYDETAGHPFLTVKLLVELVDWLIETKRRMAHLALGRADFEAFRKARLVPARISVSSEYAFFRNAIADALAPKERLRNPWLYATYATLRQVCLEYPSTLECSRDDFGRIVDLLRLTPELGLSADYILTTGGQANFLRMTSDDRVAPRIPLLGRIAAVTTPRL